MEGKFLIFLLLVAWCSVVRAEAEWSPNPIQRRSEYNYYNPVAQEEAYMVSTEEQSYESMSTHAEMNETGTGDSGKEESGTEDEEMTTTEKPPFIWTDIKVPASFLRMEYMTGYTFMGLMYGLGFLTLFQSLVVPTVKFLTAFVYIVFVTQGLMDPITLQDALEQVPPD